MALLFALLAGAASSLGSRAKTSLINFKPTNDTVFATLFVCGGTNPLSDIVNFERTFNGQHMAIIVVGSCTLPIEHRFTVLKVNHLKPASNVGHPRYTQMHAKFFLWKLPYKRVAYYDLDIVVKQPADRCAKLCASQHLLCAVKDPVAMELLGRKQDAYFNAGFLILTPSQRIFQALTRLPIDNFQFAEQDVLNHVFNNKWHELPKTCNFMHYTSRAVFSDPAIWAVHAGRF